MTGTGPPEPVAGPAGSTAISSVTPDAAEQARAAIAHGDAASAVRAARHSGDHGLLARAYELKALLDREPAWLAHALDALLAAAAHDGRDDTCNAAIDLALRINALDLAAGRFRALLAATGQVRQGESAVFARALERVHELALLQVPEPKPRIASRSTSSRILEDMILFPVGLLLALAGILTRAVWSKAAGVVGILMMGLWGFLRLSRAARRRPPPNGW